MGEVETAVQVLRPRDPENPKLLTKSLKLLTDAFPETLERYRDIVGEEWYRSYVISLSFESKSLSIKNPIKNDVVYTTLNCDQRSVFKKLHTAISESYGSTDQFVVTSPKILLLDSPSGTGKSFLLKLLSMTLNESMISIEYALALRHMMELYGNLTSCTFRRFLVRATDKTVEEVNNMFREDVSDEDGLKRAFSFWNEAINVWDKVDGAVLLILDEYTKFSPWFLYFLLVYVHAKRTNLLFVGDRYQLDPIDRTDDHDADNHILVSYIADHVFSLPAEIHKRDRLLHSLITTFQEELNFPHVVPMSFKYAYLVYHTFPKKFLLPEKLEDNLYFAHDHEKITDRTLRLLYRVEDTKIEYEDWYKAAYYLDIRLAPYEEERFEPMRRDDVSQKFLPFLLLVKGCRYFYIDKSRRYRKTVVRYLHQDDDENELDMIDEETGKTFILNRVKITKKYPSDSNVKWLKRQVWKTIPKGAKLYGIWQYPLTAYCSTYHTAQSLEVLSDETIELDIDVLHANSIYVGLTRIKNSSQLGKIHSELLPSLILTHYFNDDYYYKVDPSIHQDFCDRLEEETRTYYENYDSSESDSRIDYSSDLCINKQHFKTVKNVVTFEEYKGMCRIKRSLFDKEIPATGKSQKTKVTVLMRFCQFVQDAFATEGAAAAKIYDYSSFYDKYALWNLKN